MGKETFPSFHTYKFAQDKIRQTAIFTMLRIPHPKTRVFYGPRQKQQILQTVSLPFIATIPRGAARGRGVFLIRTARDLENYLAWNGPAYIQEYLPCNKEMRIIIVGQKVALAYWRIARPDTFKSNLAQGGRICFDPVPANALSLALFTARQCGWDDVGIDIIQARGRLYVLEGNMKYGTRGFQQAGIDYPQFLCDQILQGNI
jgi:ribosomal protein S6--L-glutamate ligase